MLSSRYLHLHEALGLGPMWLKQGAKVLPPPAAAAVSPPAAAEQTAAPAQHAAPRPAGLARSAVMNALHAAPPVSGGLNTPAPSEVPSENGRTNTAVSQPPPAPLAAAEVRPAPLMVVSICPAPEDSAAGRLFSGETGILLDNMLAAIGLSPTDAHKTAWVKTASVFTPSTEQIEAALPQLQAELAASEARAVLFLGQIFEQPRHAGIIGMLCGNLPYFTIPHPARLLRQPQLKREAWEKLKKLREILPA